MKPGKPELLLGLVGLAAGAALLLLAEGLLRFSDPGYLTRLNDNAVDRLHAYSEVYGWAPRPATRAVEHGVETAINADGYRGAPVPRARGPRRRLVLVGDSTAFGFGVPDEETYARRLAAAPDGPEVVNLGVEGYGPDQALLKLEREGLAFAPDVVVMSFCVDNDFADARLPVFLYDGRHPKPYFSPAGDALILHDEHLRLGPAARAALWLRERSQLFNRLLALWPAAPARGWHARREAALGDPPAAVEVVARLLLRMRADSAARGARFLLLSHPGKESYNRGSRLWDALAARLRAAQVELLDLAAAYRARGLRFADFAFDSTGHLTPAGHAAAAEELRARLAAP